MSVDYAVTGSGFNQADSLDFGGSLPSGTINFGIGEDSAQLEIVVTSDTSTEFDEMFEVTLSNVTGGYGLNTSSLTATIENDDSSLSISADDAAKNEGQNGDTTPFTFLVTRGGNTSGEVTADYTIILNNANACLLYTSPSPRDA